MLASIDMINISIDFRRLRCFLAVAEELHFRRAAERLSMTQPPLSMAVKSLEDELGVQLFERTTRTVRLTQAGLVLRDRTQRLFDDLERTVHLVQRTAAGMEGTLRIGFVGIATVMGLPGLIRETRRRFPKVHIELEELPTEGLVERLTSGSLDIAFVRGEPPEPLDYRTYRTEPYWLALADGHPWAKREAVSVTELDGESLLFFPRRFQPEVHDEWIAAFVHIGIRPNFAQEIHSLRSELAMVAAGVGFALVTQSIAQQPHAGVRFVPLMNFEPKVEVNVAWNADQVSESAQRFLELLEINA